MRALTFEEVAALRASIAPIDHTFQPDTWEDVVYTDLVSRGCMRSFDESPTLTIFEITDLGRLALRVSLPAG